MRIAILCIILTSLVLSSCAKNPSLAPSLVPMVSQTPPTKTSNPSSTAVTAATPTLDRKAIIVNPADLFSLPELQELSTPGSRDFCEDLPSPQISSNSNKTSVISGRFFLCPSRSRPWVNSAIDLDLGVIVSSENESADIVMEYAHVPIDGTISYFVMGLNNGSIDEVEATSLSYEHCENVLASLVDRNDSGILNVDDEAIACVLTTENRIALIRVEEIYALDTQSVAFSFAILKNE